MNTISNKEKRAKKLERQARVKAAQEKNHQPKQRGKKKPKPTAQEFTPQQKKNYWMQRIVDKSNTAFKYFYKDMDIVVDWAHHAGMDDKERSQLALMMADRFSAILRRLAPQKEVTNDTAEKVKKDIKKTSDTKAEDKKN